MNCEPLIDAKAAAELLGIHERTVRDKAQAGELPGLRIGTRWRFRESSLDLWIRGQLPYAGHPRSPSEEMKV